MCCGACRTWFRPCRRSGGSRQKPLEIIYGIDLASYDTLPPKFRYLSGGPFQGPYDVIVDDYFAGMNHMKVGDKIEMLAHDFRICGNRSARKGLPQVSAAGNHAGPDEREGRASVFYLKLDDPANADAVEKAIQADTGDGKVLGALHAGISVDDDARQSSGV